MSPCGGATSRDYDFQRSPIRDVEHAPHPRSDQHLPPSPPVSPRPSNARLNEQRASDAREEVSRKGRSTIDRVVDTLRRLKDGHPPTSTLSGHAIFAITPIEFVELQEQLDNSNGTSAEELAHWYHDQVRDDYNPSTGLYTIRMPTAVHECFTASVVNALDRAIDDLVVRLSARKRKSRAATVDALRRVFKGASTTINLDASGSETEEDSADENCCSRRDSGIGMMPVRHSPDASYYHHDASALPQLIVEVGYSQQLHNLSRLAESYVIDSRHAIRCVLGFDIPYSSNAGSPIVKSRRPHHSVDRTATISVWRPTVELDQDGEEVGVCACDMDAVVFRNSNNTACEGVLTLTLADLLPPTTLKTLPASAARESISIPFADLAACLDTAEQTQATMVARSCHSSPTSSPTKFRKRKRSPFEALSDERELAYLRQELNELEKDSKVDRIWRSPSRKAKVWHPLEPRRSPRNMMKIKSELDSG